MSLVAGLPTDGVLGPLLQQALGRAGVDRLAVALTQLAEDPSEDQLIAATTALASAHQRLTVELHADTSVFLNPAETDPEAAIIEDVLALVVDDALETVLAAADSSGS
jgi:hypothetical protein